MTANTATQLRVIPADDVPASGRRLVERPGQIRTLKRWLGKTGRFVILVVVVAVVFDLAVFELIAQLQSSDDLDSQNCQPAGVRGTSRLKFEPTASVAADPADGNRLLSVSYGRPAAPIVGPRGDVARSSRLGRRGALSIAQRTRQDGANPDAGKRQAMEFPT